MEVWRVLFKMDYVWQLISVNKDFGGKIQQVQIINAIRDVMQVVCIIFVMQTLESVVNVKLVIQVNHVKATHFMRG